MSMSGVMQGHKLLVHIVRAEGLQHMNHFTGDHPYCVCEVQHLDTSAKATKVETQPATAGDTLNPVWDEAWEIEPWFQGEALEFTVYDKGLLGAKTEGKVRLDSETFFPQGFSGMVPISDLPNAQLQLEVQVLGMAGAEAPAPAPDAVTYGAPMAMTYPPSTTTYTYSAPQGATYPTQVINYQQAPDNSLYTHGVATGPVTYAAPPMVTYTTTPQTMPATIQQPLTYAAPPASMVTMQVPSSTAMPQQTMLPMEAQPQKLAVSILQAHGLAHMNHFTGDHPYVTCEVKHHHGHAHTTKVETKPVTEGDTSNPFWGETHTLDPWHPGEPLEFSVYDKGLIGSKTEGKVTLSPELFYPNGFSGMLLISGLPHALLHVIVRPMGPSSKEAAVEQGTQEESSKKKRKKLRTGKKQKGCC